MADLISKFKGTDNVTYDLQDKISTFGNENLFKLSAMNDRTNFVSNGSTDWTAHFRFYNGDATKHTFSVWQNNEYQDTILLNAASNLGVCFVRSAADINLDSNSYYTMSCWAKTTKANTHIDLGLSYYNNSNTWVWRGGSNAKNFSATNTWQYFTHTFKPDADTQYICYCFTVLGVSNGTDTFTIRNCKLEKGSKSTVWTPSSKDLVTYSSETLEFFQ